MSDTGYPIIVHHRLTWSDPSSLLSFLIRLVTKCYWNHSAMVVVIDGFRYVAEARLSGIVIVSWDEWIKHRPNKVYSIGWPVNHMNIPADMLTRILSKAGVRYDLIGLFWWHPLRLLFGRWKGGIAESGKMVCSEYVGWCWKEFFPRNWMYLTTKEIAESPNFKFIL